MDMFNFGGRGCKDVKLYPLGGGAIIEISRLKFRESSENQVIDIIKNEVNKQNQDLVIDSIVCSRNAFDKLREDPHRRYKMSCMVMPKFGISVYAGDLTLGNVDIKINMRNIEIDGEQVNIGYARMMAYPYGEYKYQARE